MPKRHLYWSRGAENDLTRLWIDHPALRNTIALESIAIERQLESDAERFADESRTEDEAPEGFAAEPRTLVRAIGFKLPLGVEFVIEDSIVVVVRVWLVKPPRKGSN